VGAYPISYNYGGDPTFNAAAGAGTLNVTANVMTLFNQSQPRHAGSVIPIQIQLTDATARTFHRPTQP